MLERYIAFDVETPNDDAGYIREIRQVREWLGE